VKRILSSSAPARLAAISGSSLVAIRGGSTYRSLECKFQTQGSDPPPPPPTK
jgi:hypothetical protein